MLILASLNMEWCREGTTPSALWTLGPSYLKSKGIDKTWSLPHLSHRDLQTGIQKKHTQSLPSTNIESCGKVTSRKMKIYLLDRHTYTYPHPLINSVRAHRGNPSDKWIMEDSSKMIFSLGLEIQVLIIHEEIKIRMKAQKHVRT